MGSEILTHSRHENLTQLRINVKGGGSINCFYLGRLWLLEYSVWEHTAFMSVTVLCLDQQYSCLLYLWDGCSETLGKFML